MRFHNILEDLLASPANAKIMALFLSYPSKQFSGREVARHVQLSPMGAWRALKTLEAQGIITRSRVGASDIFSLNTSHFLTRELEPLAHLEEKAISKVKQILLESLPKEKIETIYLFGSAARGEERPTSDLDVLILTKNKPAVLKAADKAALRIIDTFSNHPSIIVFTPDEFKKDNSNLFKEVRKEGQIIYKRGMDDA